MTDSSDILFSSSSQADADGQWLCDTSCARLYRIKKEEEVLIRKDLKKGLLSDTRYRQIWRKEYTIGHELNSPFVVRYHQLLDIPDACSLFLDFVDGDTLLEANLSPSEILRVISQLLDGLSELHAHGVLHLDLKPSNIMLTRLNNDVRIIDLGGCYSSRFPFSPAVTDQFAAPETLDASLRPGISADLFSIGKVIEYLLSHCDKEKLSSSDKEAEKMLRKVVDKSTQPDPKQRYGSAQEMKQALIKTKKHHVFIAVFSIFVLIASLNYGLPWLRGYDFIAFDSRFRILSDSTSILVRYYTTDLNKQDYSVPHLVTYHDREYVVSAIGENAFENNHAIKTLSISSTIDSIAPYAFLWCDSLHTVFLPSALRHLGEGAFSNCTNLISIRLPQTLIEIPRSCFHHTGFTSFTVPEGVTTISQDAFVDCFRLQHITFPSTLQTIERGAFFKCPELTEIDLPSSLRFLGEYAFMECPTLHTVRCHAPQPPYASQVFSAGQQITLMVPQSSVDLYRQDAEWGKLKIIPLQE